MRKLPFIALAVLAAVGCSRHDSPDPGSLEAEALAEESAATIEEAEAGQKGRGPWANNIGKLSEVFNDSNYIQYEYAERLGIDPIHTLYDAYNTCRPLVKIESSENYEVDELTHSMPYLVPEAARLLDEIGSEFGSLLRERGGRPEYNRILVTSVLRSPYTVRRLRRVNRNAVDSSTHMFGTTFDIAWNHFHYPDTSKSVDPGVLKGILAEVLLKKRNEGRCLVKYERKTPCFHITAIR